MEKYFSGLSIFDDVVEDQQKNVFLFSQPQQGYFALLDHARGQRGLGGFRRHQFVCL